MNTHDFITKFRTAAGKLRTDRLLGPDEKGREISAFEDKISRREVTTIEDVNREIAALEGRYAGRRAPADLSPKGRKERVATFPTEEAAAGFAKNFRKDSGAYGMKRDGKRVTFKAHPDDHRLTATIHGAEAWGGSVK
jgi:hypothetical protein